MIANAFAFFDEVTEFLAGFGIHAKFFGDGVDFTNVAFTPHERFLLLSIHRNIILSNHHGFVK